jgi:hypothetical protein
MSKDEIIDDLIDKGIVAVIGDNYLITEKYKELLAGTTKVIMPEIKKAKLSYDELLNTKTNGNDWPVEILESQGRARGVALMDLCEIPTIASKGYRLRGLDKDAINIIGNIISSLEINPPTFIEAITMYYKHTEMPKSFKNLLIEGDVLDIYNEHIEGTLAPSLDISPNDTREWH